MKILIVDDSTTMHKIIVRFLHRDGFNDTITCTNGEEALCELKKNNVNLIISDWHMPVMSGFELLKYIRRTEAYKNIPFLMLTAEGLTKKVQIAFEEGVSDYLIKPFRAKDLSEKVKQYAT